eukprot:364899-Prymnesium_polylepis.2
MLAVLALNASQREVLAVERQHAIDDAAISSSLMKAEHLANCVASLWSGRGGCSNDRHIVGNPWMVRISKELKVRVLPAKVGSPLIDCDQGTHMDTEQGCQVTAQYTDPVRDAREGLSGAERGCHGRGLLQWHSSIATIPSLSPRSRSSVQ